MEFGFCNFYDVDDKSMVHFFSTANNIDVLGLRKMNLRISDILFPECSTLMPNLVYIYYLNAIYYCLKELGREWNEAEWKAAVNQIETLISQNIKSRDDMSKGFFDKAKERAYTKYYNKMVSLHYFEEDWKPSAVVKNADKKSQQAILKETNRYKLVQSVVTAGFSDNSQSVNIKRAEEKLIAIMKPEGEDYKEDYEEIYCKLDGYERMDYIRRVLEGDESRICKYSYFCNIIMEFLGIKSIAKNRRLYEYDKLEDFFAKNNKKTDSLCDYFQKNELIPLPKFADMKFGKNIAGQSYEKGERQYEIMRAAQIYSELQYIAKLTYNKILFRNQEEKCETYRKNLDLHIRAFCKNDNVSGDIWFSQNRKKLKEIFCGKNTDEVLEGSYYFIHCIDVTVREYWKNYENHQMYEGNQCIKDLEAIVIKREQEVLGDESMLESGIAATKGIADYVDTFRWEYRPQESYEKVEASEQAEADGNSEDCTEQDENSREADKINIMSAQFYIKELFLE